MGSSAQVSGEPAVQSGKAIRFVLDGEVITVENPQPTRTVLQFLREDLQRTGSKEGCAEGDCGACTVVLVELCRDGNALVARAINACIQFLPTLDGKELITVESLAQDSTGLHPVQQAMVECHASQCGFCTPGFVMSLFALYKAGDNSNGSGKRPGRREIDDALAGNLCRCTGYRPIIAAAEAMFTRESAHGTGNSWLMTPGPGGTGLAEKIALLESLQRQQALVCGEQQDMFLAPHGIPELLACLAENPRSTLLAGGTDVGLWVTKQYRDLGTVVYLGKVAELGRIEVTPTHLELGACVTLSDALPVLHAHFPQLDELFRRFASPPIRNAATLGGNIANGSPIGDSMPALIVLGASLQLRSQAGSREISLEDFYTDYMVNDLQAGEFVECIRIPRPTGSELLRSYKVSKRFDQDISAVCAAFNLTIDAGRVTHARVAFGGMAATVRRAGQCEQALSGQPWSDGTVQAAMQALTRDFTPLNDMRASAGYRMQVAQNLLRRMFLESEGVLTDTVYDYGRAS